MSDWTPEKSERAWRWVWALLILAALGYGVAALGVVMEAAS